MKILTYFLTLSIATIMLLYNQRAFLEVKRIINQVDLISETLEQRGRQRYLLQKHLTVVKSSSEYSSQQLNDLIDSHVFDSRFGQFISAEDYPKLIDWKKSQQTIEYIKNLIVQFPIDNPQDILIKQKFNVEDWTNRMVDTLDQMQQQNILLASRLNSLMTNRLARAVTINIVLMASIFLVILVYNYRKNKANTAKTFELNESLISRERALISSKKVLISLMEDLSQEKNAAINLSKMLEKANQKLKLKHNDMEQFIYTVSHDLKAPLVTIGSFSEILFDQLKSSLNDKQSHKFNRINENVREMKGLLSDLLEISRVMTTELEKSTINTQEFITSQLSPLEEQIKQAGSRVLVVEPMLEIFGNPRLIGLCITNLVSNAIRYRHLERDLKIEISTHMTANGVELSIKDNGIGIETKDHERIFKVFERLTDGEGSGVGLAIVKAVIDKHDGTIALDSKPGTGSTFSLTFPFATSERKN